MAHEVAEKSTTELRPYQFDFTGVLPSTDATLDAVSTVLAYDSSGALISSTIVTNIARTGVILSCDLQNGSNGEDYKVVFQAKGGTSAKTRERVLELRVRNNPSNLVA